MFLFQQNSEFGKLQNVEFLKLDFYGKSDFSNLVFDDVRGE